MSDFGYCYAYEDRSEAHTSRWLLKGVSTRGVLANKVNLQDGRLWMTATDTNDTVTVNLYRDVAMAAGDLVATGTADISGIDDDPAKCTLTASNSSGMTGEFYFEEYTSDPAAAVEVLVSLAMDTDLAIEYGNIADLPAFNATSGMDDVLAAATRKTLLLVSQQFAEDLGGFRAPENRHRPNATRTVPDYRCLANPDQLRDACVHWALMLAFGQSHERSNATMYSELRNYHDEKRKEAIASWNLAFNSDPDTDDDATDSQHGGAVQITRL